jgi:hypothetical protein
MEAICSSETSVDTQRTTWRHIPEDDTLQNHRCENLKSYIHLNIFVDTVSDVLPLTDGQTPSFGGFGENLVVLQPNL